MRGDREKRQLQARRNTMNGFVSAPSTLVLPFWAADDLLFGTHLSGGDLRDRGQQPNVDDGQWPFKQQVVLQGRYAQRIKSRTQFGVLADCRAVSVIVVSSWRIALGPQVTLAHAPCTKRGGTHGTVRLPARAASMFNLGVRRLLSTIIIASGATLVLTTQCTRDRVGLISRRNAGLVDCARLPIWGHIGRVNESREAKGLGQSNTCILGSTLRLRHELHWHRATRAGKVERGALFVGLVALPSLPLISRPFTLVSKG
jgi:hypothetical protein